MLEQLRAIDPAMLLKVVRRDQRSPEFEIMDWTVGVLSTKGAGSPDGMFFFSGHGRDHAGTRPWSVALKILKDPGEPDVAASNWWYWRRELLVSQSGLLERLPEPVHAPRIYGTAEYEGGAWIWMERIIESTAAHWELDQYAFAARQIGRFNAAYAGSGVPLPDDPWLARNATLTWITTWSPDKGWDNPYVQRYISPHMRERILELWADRDRFLLTLNRMPQILTHGDLHRRNLLIRKRKDGEDELVAVDWEKYGIGPLGGDLTKLISASALLFEWEPTDLQNLENATFDAYVTGLQDASWRGNPAHIRLAYTASMAMWMGVIMPAGIAAFTQDEMKAGAVQRTGHHTDELAAGWSKLGEFGLDRADEARQLMAQLELNSR